MHGQDRSRGRALWRFPPAAAWLLLVVTVMPPAHFLFPEGPGRPPMATSSCGRHPGCSALLPNYGSSSTLQAEHRHDPLTCRTCHLLLGTAADATPTVNESTVSLPPSTSLVPAFDPPACAEGLDPGIPRGPPAFTC